MRNFVEQAEGRLGVLLPGLGAVATTLIAGVEAIKKNLAQPVGTLTQMGNIRLGKRTENRYPKVKDFVTLADLNDIVFGGWDEYSDNVFEAATKAKVLEPVLLHAVRAELEAIKPMKAVFDRAYVQNLDGEHVLTGANKAELASLVMDDSESFRAGNNCARMVLVWCGSTEKFKERSPVHETIESFEQGLRNDASAKTPSMIYAYASIKQGVPFMNGAPNLTCDIPALIELAKQSGTPIGGKDFKTGQTLMKTILAPGLPARALGIRGWFSSNLSLFFFC